MPLGEVERVDLPMNGLRAVDPRIAGESFELDMSAAITPENVPFWPWGLLLFIAGLYVVGVAALIAAGRREDARALAGFIPDCLVLVSRLARDRRISRPRRALLFLVLGYLALPIDLVPDFLPGIGQLDDAVLLGLALRVRGARRRRRARARGLAGPAGVAHPGPARGRPARRTEQPRRALRFNR